MALERLGGRSDLPNGAPAVLSELTSARLEDAIFLFYAGHGTSAGPHFYLIPHDLGFNGPRDRIDEEGAISILRHSLSDAELDNAFEQVDDAEKILIADACRSGQGLQAEDPRQSPMNSKDLGQLAYDKGMYIPTASQGYQAALETTFYQHGLLTYALMDQGLKAGLADDDPKDGQITLREWLDFATQEVPQLQLEAMEDANRRGEDLTIVEGEQRIKELQQRTLQHPRVLYRREPETKTIRAGDFPNPQTSRRASRPRKELPRQPREFRVKYKVRYSLLIPTRACFPTCTRSRKQTLH